MNDSNNSNDTSRLHVAAHRNAAAGRAVVQLPAAPAQVLPILQLGLHVVQHLGGFKGSATKGQFRECGLTAFVSDHDPKKQGKGGNEALESKKKTPFSTWPFTMDPLISHRSTERTMKLRVPAEPCREVRSVGRKRT